VWSWLGVFDSNDDPLDHAVAASDGNRLALVSDNSSGFEPASGSPPHYWDPQSAVYDGKRLRRLGYWTVTAISGEYLAGYDWYTDPVARAQNPNVSASRQRAVRWHAGKTEILGLGVALAVNMHGVVVGAGQIKYPFMCPVVFSSTIPTCLINRYGIAYSISNDGTIVGFFRDEGNEDHAFIARGGRVLDLDQLVPKKDGRTLGRAFVIDSSGRIIAWGHEGGREALFVLEPK
jgi:probable HAF family extracellular repeat protein